MNKRQTLTLAMLATTGFCLFGGSGCKPQTTGQKIEDKVEDAGHEINQGAERMGENMENKK